MEIPLFPLLLFIPASSVILYCLEYEKKDLTLILLLIIVSFFILRFDKHPLLFSMLFLFIPFLLKERISYTQLFFFSMTGSILLAKYLFSIFAEGVFYLLPTAIFTLILMCLLSIVSIFEDDLRRFLLISNVIQTLFILLDMLVAEMGGEEKLMTIQAFNYTLAGTVFFSSLGIASFDNRAKRISSLQGSYYLDKLNGISTVIASLSLAGVPGLNMFVSEWLLFKTSFHISPVISIFGIFLALLLFIMYFKIINITLTGKVRPHLKRKKISSYFNFFLSIFCLLLGLIPRIQFYILEGLM